MPQRRYADVAELADALDSGSSEREFMWVQVPSSAPRQKLLLQFLFFCIIENPAIVAGFREVIHLNSKKTSCKMKLRLALQDQINRRYVYEYKRYS